MRARIGIGKRFPVIMVELVEPSWLQEHLDDQDLTVIDPRPPVDYLQGHVQGAVNLPLSRILDKETTELISDEQLARVFSSAGINRDRMVVLYDEYDGQNAAMVAWALEYLGHPNVKVLNTFIERWKGEGHELWYKPVKAGQSGDFQPKVNGNIRACWQDVVRGEKAIRVIDLRSEGEFLGLDNEAGLPRAGHIPDAINIPWTNLLDKENDRLLLPTEKLKETVPKDLRSAESTIVTYCNYGPRAAIGYIALQQLGYGRVRLYDGSFHQWSQKLELPVAGEEGDS